MPGCGAPQGGASGISLLVQMCRHETGPVFFFSGFPDDNDFIYGHETHFLVTVLQVKYSFLDLNNFAAQTGSPAAKGIYLLANHFG
jgi:hypothetical protein